ncbi:hypothetical protein MAM1_0002c00196 [Mucor ambiguus]|uniref:Uncharacterized protein n=1 Tax=Mucor ambiguus TaxID=91626 RepID=A0A0C9MFT5_9FUNG|nr:hypothetical protein MAM1_0002c00196 [Mucor ambiguus]
MPNSLASLTDSIESNSITHTIGNLARAATTRHRHSQHLSSTTALPVPPPPQHTNVSSHSHDHTATAASAHRLSADCSSSAPSHVSHSPSSSSSHLDNRRNSAVGLSAVDGPINNMTIEFDGGTHVIVRPNRIIRGKVILTAVERLYVTRIRVKFRAEEVAIVRVDEGGGENKGGERLHENITTFFEADWKLWGNDATAYSQAGWDELEPGKYEFPFALKFPNVNYPPSMEEPKGFSIRYVWTAQVDGPALQSGLKSREYLTPYRPIIVSTPDRQWEYRKTLMRDKRNIAAEVIAKLVKQSYCPDEPFVMHLKIFLGQSDSRITSVGFKFRKHHEGKMLVQRGTAFREHIRVVLQGQIPVPGSDFKFEQDISFDVPTRLVSPSFISHHTRVYYDIQFQVTMEHGGLFKSTHTSEFAIPITIANLPYDQLLRIPGLTSIEFYKTSKESPQFFDPTLEEPPEQSALPSELLGSIQTALMTSTPRDEPPNYFSIPTLPSQLELRKERKERSVYLTRSVRGNAPGAELTEAMVIPGLFDESW